MSLDRLMWVFGALFILFGVPLGFVEDTGWQRLFGGMSVLFLGCFALAMAGDGLVKGEIRLQFSLIRRAAQPRLFWATIALVFTAGVGVLVAAGWAIFFKTW